MAGVVQVLEDVVGSEAGEGSEVLDGLHPGIRTSDLPERYCPGPKAQKFHGRGVPVWNLSKVTLVLPRYHDTPTTILLKGVDSNKS